MTKDYEFHFKFTHYLIMESGESQPTWNKSMTKNITLYNFFKFLSHLVVNTSGNVLIFINICFSFDVWREEKIIDMWSGIYMIFRSSTSCVTRATRRMSLVEQEQPIHQKHLSSPPVYSRARVVFCVLLCRLLFLLLAIALSILLWFTDYYYHFGIF